ncbi:DUF4097 family beta strand repeat-containing protein [Anaerocolumna xylanovorans]|uniref:DUF4097 domain-containing protein n=1 Tax=Anaerocolumna xylanovorans DSM 12503 TaxID=1121345 RepID=A0A1M7XYG5_9FIRM|nr:DUF4097 family beta strand repeat-containing protein [Anaerocolumna xylanovorans]SHO44046.1 Protein of unknown function [Anaerocolumna xylanovorans DSM 12503]
MNKTEYLNALKEALKDTDESVMEEIVSDYEEHFQVGMEYGKSEEQICEELGAIDDLAKEIREVYSGERKDDKKTKDTNQNAGKNKSHEEDFNIHHIDGEKIGEAINSALDMAGDAISKIDVNEIGRTVKSTLDQVTSSISNFTYNYLKDQGTGTADAGKRNGEGYRENVTKSYDNSTKADEEKSDKEITANTYAGLNLIVDGICADINVQKSTDGKINIRYENNGNERQWQMYEFYSYQKGNTVYAGIRRIGKAVFLFNYKQSSININIEVPEDMGDVNLKTASGSIQVSDVTVERMLAGTASGDLKAEDVTAKFLSLKSASGDIEARNITADIIDNSSLSGDLECENIKTSECKISSTSGDVEINEFAMNHADISSLSGDIEIPHVTGEDLRVSSISGSVSLGVNVNRCYISSKSGDIEVKCNGDLILESGNISGDIRVHLKNHNNGYCIKSKTTSGKFDIDYDAMHHRNLKTGTYSYGGKGSELSLSTVSGDIRLYD